MIFEYVMWNVDAHCNMMISSWKKVSSIKNVLFSGRLQCTRLNKVQLIQCILGQKPCNNSPMYVY